MLTDKRLMFVKKEIMSHKWKCHRSEEWINCHKVIKIKLILKVLFVYYYYNTL
jgi:hypothetical protein